MTEEFFDLAHGEVELAIWQGAPQDRMLVVRRIADVPWGVFASRAYIEAHGRPAQPKAVAEHPVVEFAGPIKNHAAAVWMRSVAPRARIAARGNSVSEIMEAIRSGVGVGPLPIPHAKRESDLVMVLDSRPELNFPFYVVIHRDMQRVRRVRAFLDFLADSRSSCAARSRSGSSARPETGHASGLGRRTPFRTSRSGRGPATIRSVREETYEKTPCGVCACRDPAKSRRRAGAKLADAADHPGGALRGGWTGRHRRTDRVVPHVRASRSADRRRELPRRRRHERGRAGGESRAGRLHGAAVGQRHALAGSQPLQETGLQSAHRFRACGHPFGFGANSDHPAQLSGQHARRIHRLFEGQSGEHAVRLGGRRLGPPHLRGSSQWGDGHHHDARALSRLGACGAGPDRRPHRLHGRPDFHRAAPDSGDIP